MSLNWDLSPSDELIVEQIARRALREFELSTTALVDIQMDLVAAHNHGTPLDLDGLLLATAADFLHDIGGIREHLDRRTGKLGGCFVPRHARRIGAVIA